MSDGIVLILASIFSLAGIALMLAWFMVLPTIGLLWVFGWLT